MTDLERADKLREILYSYCPDETAHLVVYEMECKKALFKDYLHAICDGLWYGNWPWITYSRYLTTPISKPKPVELEDFASFDEKDLK